MKGENMWQRVADDIDRCGRTAKCGKVSWNAVSEPSHSRFWFCSSCRPSSCVTPSVSARNYENLCSATYRPLHHIRSLGNAFSLMFVAGGTAECSSLLNVVEYLTVVDEIWSIMADMILKGHLRLLNITLCDRSHGFLLVFCGSCLVSFLGLVTDQK